MLDSLAVATETDGLDQLTNSSGDGYVPEDVVSALERDEAVKALSADARRGWATLLSALADAAEAVDAVEDAAAATVSERVSVDAPCAETAANMSSQLIPPDPEHALVVSSSQSVPLQQPCPPTKLITIGRVPPQLLSDQLSTVAERSQAVPEPRQEELLAAMLPLARQMYERGARRTEEAVQRLSLAAQGASRVVSTSATEADEAMPELEAQPRNTSHVFAAAGGDVSGSQTCVAVIGDAGNSPHSHTASQFPVVPKPVTYHAQPTNVDTAQLNTMAFLADMASARPTPLADAAQAERNTANTLITQGSHLLTASTASAASALGLYPCKHGWERAHQECVDCAVCRQPCL